VSLSGSEKTGAAMAAPFFVPLLIGLSEKFLGEGEHIIHGIAVIVAVQK
jgi:hypothetical protein